MDEHPAEFDQITAVLRDDRFKERATLPYGGASEHNVVIETASVLPSRPDGASHGGVQRHCADTAVVGDAGEPGSAQLHLRSTCRPGSRTTVRSSQPDRFFPNHAGARQPLDAGQGPPSRSTFLLMTNPDALADFLSLVADVDVPRLGWPTSLLPPDGVHVEAFERGSSLSIFASSEGAEAGARLDLITREVVVTSSGMDAVQERALRRLVLSYVADRNAFDEQCGIETHPAPPDRGEDDPDRWTSMQLLAAVTEGSWYPPAPARKRHADWAEFFARTEEFNREFRRPRDVATAPRPVPPQAGQSSAGLATPDPPGPAGE